MVLKIKVGTPKIRGRTKSLTIFISLIMSIVCKKKESATPKVFAIFLILFYSKKYCTLHNLLRYVVGSCAMSKNQQVPDILFVIFH